MTKKEQFKKLIRKLEKNVNKLPIAKKASDIVPPEGDLNAELMFIGEAPGYHEHVQRRPFVGAAGKLLTQCLNKIGIERNKVWISNVVKARPPQNRDPSLEEIEAYRPYVDEEIHIINPRIIITLGRFSMAKFIKNAYISRIHGQARWSDWEGKKILIFPMYHPAAALRNGQVMKQFKEDFEKLKKTINTLNNQSDIQKTESVQKRNNAGPENNQQLSLI
jgi:uracil-DNA glycosylase family 4